MQMRLGLLVSLLLLLLVVHCNSSSLERKRRKKRAPGRFPSTWECIPSSSSITDLTLDPTEGATRSFVEPISALKNVNQNLATKVVELFQAQLKTRIEKEAAAQTAKVEDLQNSATYHQSFYDALKRVDSHLTDEEGNEMALKAILFAILGPVEVLAGPAVEALIKAPEAVIRVVGEDAAKQGISSLVGFVRDEIVEDAASKIFLKKAKFPTDYFTNLAKKALKDKKTSTGLKVATAAVKIGVGAIPIVGGPVAGLGDAVNTARTLMNQANERDRVVTQQKTVLTEALKNLQARKALVEQEKTTTTTSVQQLSTLKNSIDITIGNAKSRAELVKVLGSFPVFKPENFYFNIPELAALERQCHAYEAPPAAYNDNAPNFGF